MIIIIICGVFILASLSGEGGKVLAVLATQWPALSDTQQTT